MAEPHVVVLGAGPSGLGAAYQLRRRERAQVTVIEQADVVGGNAASFVWRGQRLDYGSHRLHPACDPDILADIRQLLGSDLLDRPRHGRIRLRGKWIHFPLKPVDLLLRLDRTFGLGVAGDMASKALRLGPKERDSFAGVLWANLGPTICTDFYFPYARKIWGRDPEELSAIQARRRVSAGSFGRLVKKVLTAVPGLKPKGSGRFFYPREGYGQISEGYLKAAASLGANLRMRTRLDHLRRSGGKSGWEVGVVGPDGPAVLQADHVWSTIPITILARAMRDPVPDAVTAAASQLQYRAMILVYLALDVDQFTEFDAHYFPGADIRITRLSEPKNFALRSEPRGETVLCAELPCNVDDDVWNMDDRQLGALVANDLARAGLPLQRPPVDVFTRRLRQAYPLYLQGYEGAFQALDGWADTLPDFLTLGRQGLFAHDNTHHTLAMAYRAVDCLTPNGFDRAQWHRHREDFAKHVVED
jgi:protoporphyrinogen oxidase